MNDEFNTTNSLPPSDSIEHQQKINFLLAEFSALRTNIMDSTGKQYQQITIALGGFGTLASFSLGLTNVILPVASNPLIDSKLLILIYPFLSVFLAFLYYEQEIAIQRMALYIKQRIEKDFLGQEGGWEKYFEKVNKIDPTKKLSSKSIFISTQILALIIYILKVIEYTNYSGQISVNVWNIVGFGGFSLFVLDLIVIYITFHITTKKAKFINWYS